MALTDTQIRNIERWADGLCRSDWQKVAGLIADLRASRERIRELEEDLKGKMTRQEWYEDYARW